MTRTRSRRVVLLLDCCYAGAFERGMTARAGTGVGIEEQFGGRGRAVITASSAMEYAFEGDQLADSHALAPSVFTSALVEGLETGDADRDQDGLVGLDELYDYVYDRVRAATPNQTPGKWTFGVQGEPYIARRSRPVTTPAPLQPELQEAVDSPFAGVRAGAVQELERLLTARHAGLALAARLALERLVSDDSRRVSAAASTALGIQPPPPQPAPPQPAPPLPEAARPEPAPTDPAPPPRPPPTAPTPEPAATREPAAAPAAPAPQAPTPQATAQPVAAAAANAPAAAGDGRLRIAGSLAILSAALGIVGLSLPYQDGQRLPVARPGVVWSVGILAAVAVAAGVCLLLPRTRRWVGPGLLLGVAVGAAAGFLGPLSDPLQQDGFGSGWAVGLLATLALLAAAWLVILALAREGEVRLVRGRPQGPLAWVIVVLGVVAALAMAVFAKALWQEDGGWYVTEFIGDAAVAVAVAAGAALAVPRQFGASLLAGWAGTAVATSLFHATLLEWLRSNGYSHIASDSFVVFGLAALALLVVAPFLARAAPAPGSGQRQQPAPSGPPADR